MVSAAKLAATTAPKTTAAISMGIDASLETGDVQAAATSIAVNNRATGWRWSDRIASSIIYAERAGEIDTRFLMCPHKACELRKREHDTDNLPQVQLLSQVQLQVHKGASRLWHQAVPDDRVDESDVRTFNARAAAVPSAASTTSSPITSWNPAVAAPANACWIETGNATPMSTVSP